MTLEAYTVTNELRLKKAIINRKVGTSKKLATKTFKFNQNLPTASSTNCLA